jgi:hypothetical protein
MLIMSNRLSRVRERRSQFFGELLERLGVAFARNGSGQVDNTVPLRIGSVSLQLYFNESNWKWGAYFATHEGLYRGYHWTQYWLPAPVGKVGSGYQKMVPYPGLEHEALADLVKYVESVKQAHV